MLPIAAVLSLTKSQILPFSIELWLLRRRRAVSLSRFSAPAGATPTARGIRDGSVTQQQEDGRNNQEADQHRKKYRRSFGHQMIQRTPEDIAHPDHKPMKVEVTTPHAKKAGASAMTRAVKSS